MIPSFRIKAGSQFTQALEMVDQNGDETSVGALTAGGGGGANYKGKGDAIQVRNRSISDAEGTEVYNLGAGKQVPFTTANSNFLFFM